MKKWASVIALLVISNLAEAETAGELVSKCRLVAGAQLQGERILLPADGDTQFCWGFFAVFQSVSVIADSEGKPFLGLCLPEESTRAQLVAVYMKYMDDHPETLHMPAIGSVLHALHETWPCLEAELLLRKLQLEQGE